MTRTLVRSSRPRRDAVDSGSAAAATRELAERLAADPRVPMRRWRHQ
jgi:hypothetical protein